MNPGITSLAKRAVRISWNDNLNKIDLYLKSQ
jgi:hypothetical protein